MKTKKHLNYVESLWNHVPANVFIEQSSITNVNVIEEPVHFHVTSPKFDSIEEVESVSKLAIGRLFMIMSRPSKKGDVELYYKLKDIIMDASEYLKQNN